MRTNVSVVTTKATIAACRARERTKRSTRRELPGLAGRPLRCSAYIPGANRHPPRVGPERRRRQATARERRDTMLVEPHRRRVIDGRLIRDGQMLARRHEIAG